MPFWWRSAGYWRRCGIERFFALAELNEAIAELLEKLNHRPFRKREGTRASLFAEVDRPALQPLPAERYVIASWKTVRANIDYHVEVDRHYYSVPYQLAGQQLEARFTATTVEIFHRGKRVASHPRSSAAYRHTTVREHMPKSHQAHLEWTPSRLIHWAETVVGPATAQVVRTILESKPHPEMGYRACLGIMSLGKTYSNPTARSRQPARPATAGLLLPKPQVDSETLARSPDHPRAGTGPARPAA